MTKKMLVLELSCPYCKAVLTEGTKVHLDGHVKDANQDGKLYLSAVFGDYTIESEMEVPEGAIVELRCPHCDAAIAIQIACRTCGAPMASLNHSRGGYIEFCTRRGCKGHALGGEGNVDEMMDLMNKMFETPYD